MRMFIHTWCRTLSVERYTPIALAKLYGNEAAHDELLRRPQAPPGPPSIVQSILGDTEMIRWFSHTVGEEEVLALTTARLDSGVSPDTLWDDTDFEQYRITWLQSASVRRFESVVTLLLQRRECEPHKRMGVDSPCISRRLVDPSRSFGSYCKRARTLMRPVVSATPTRRWIWRSCTGKDNPPYYDLRFSDCNMCTI